MKYVSRIDFRRSLPPVIGDLHRHLAGAFQHLAQTRDLSQLMHGGAVHDDDEVLLGGKRFMAPRLGEIDARRILPTNGTQSALMILLPFLVGRGGQLLAERLSYGSLRTIADAVGIGIRGLDLDEEGILPDAFEAACRQRQGRTALYCNPTVHNPTTAVMSAPRRLALAEIASRYGVPILEDEALGLLHPSAPSPIAKLAPDIAWYIMSASKSLAHGFRLAYIVAPSLKAREEALSPVETLSFWGASPLNAALVNHWLNTGEAARISRAIREENNAREQFAREKLGAFGLISKLGSMHVWLPLSTPWTSQQMVQAAHEMGVQIRGAERFAVDHQSPANAVRLSLSTPPTRAAAQEGILRLVDRLERGP